MGKKENKERPEGGRLWAGWLALAALSLIPGFAFNAVVIDPSVWMFAITVPVVLLLVISGFLWTPFGAMVAALMFVVLLLQRGLLNAAVTIALFYGFLMLVHFVVIEWLWRGTYPRFKFANVDRLSEAGFSEDYKLGIVSTFQDLHWAPSGAQHLDSILHRRLSHQPSEELKSLATRFESEDVLPRFFSTVLQTEQALAKALGARLGVQTVVLDWSGKDRITGKDHKARREAVKAAQLDGVANLLLHPSIRVPEEGGNHEIGVEWRMMMSKLAGSSRQLLDKTVTVSKSVDTQAGGLTIDTVLSALEGAMADVTDSVMREIGTMEETPDAEMDA